ncbi:hypothetical protein Q3G72_024921 [Acer saccharum]|nr:hypothetical protein Q3G72_024921 [Acer saccharum]
MADTVVQSDSPKEGHIFRRSGPYMRVSTSDEVYGGYGDFYAQNTLPLTPKYTTSVIFEEIRRHGLKVAVAGIPKTIDNAFQL